MISYTAVGIEIKELLTLRTVLHHCQRYALERYFFLRNIMMRRYLCLIIVPHRLMKEPSHDMAEIYDRYIFPNGIETLDTTLRGTSENHAWKYEFL
mmetsp:Transcript_28695/g.32906  ORF Transcript_28695/g.32906 Transcript_28695/m.32906 type:complete len:96 (-) Transcript_28695:252-539(-)